jgi:hypothetical protein
VDILKSKLLECDEYIKEIEQWRRIFNQCLGRYIEYTQKNKATLQIDKKEFFKVIDNTISDISLIIVRYKIFEKCEDYKGVNRYKVFGAFIYHFIKIKPICSTIRNNILGAIFIISFIKDDNYSFQTGMPIQIKREFINFLENRLITSESIYMFLSALAHQNQDLNTPLVIQKGKQK